MKTDREILIEIGNIIGKPTMTSCPEYEIKEWQERAQKIGNLLVTHFAPKPCTILLAEGNLYCPRCLMHVTLDGKPDPNVYSQEWIEKFNSERVEDHCTHRR